MKKIAIIGSGIAGTSAAYYLNKLGYDVSLFEGDSYFGGHTNTVKIEVESKQYPIDTGFLVHNNRTYPNLIHFFNELQIKTYKSEMSFSVMRKADNLLWAGNNLLTVFAQAKNLLSIRFYKFVKEVLHFNKNSKKYLSYSERQLNLTLGELLKEKGYSKDFQDWYLLPMGGCIWSSPTNEMLGFPAYTFLTFCMNHGLLQITDRPQWKTIVDGCQTYVKKALASIDKKYLNEPVIEIISQDDKIKVITSKRSEFFDYCIMSSHPPQSLEIFKGINEDVKKVLENFKYQKNIAVLHCDESVLPPKKSVRAAWNYLSVKSNDSQDAVSVSYLINKLQPLPFKQSVIVSLNPVVEIDKNKIYKTINYEHPLFSTEAIQAQEQMKRFQGKQRVYFSGAWMRYGFHEDGILSSKEVINQLLIDDGLTGKLLTIL